jgi:hypothetical protein
MSLTSGSATISSFAKTSLDQPDVFVRGLLEVPRESTINPWFFLAYGDAFSSDYYATIEIDVPSKYPN